MRHFTQQAADDIMTGRIESADLARQYPELKDVVMTDFSRVGAGSGGPEIARLINGYKTKARLAGNRLQKGGNSAKTRDAFLPEIIKARIAIHLLDQMTLAAKTGKTSGRIRFNLWDGFILQKLLFHHDLERKPVSVRSFKRVWRLVINKRILMPLVNKKGIYCFYSKELVRGLAKLIGPADCIEIGAGDGTLTRLLIEAGVNCLATDDYSWSQYIQYPASVEKLDARQALDKYRPQVVICSWPPPGNSFEKLILNADSVSLYITIGTRNALYSGDHAHYATQQRFTATCNEILSAMILPPSSDNAVYVFERQP